MISIAEPRGYAHRRSEDLRAFSIMCKMPTMAHTVTSSLEHAGFRFDTTATTLIMFDIPRGFALHMLESSREASRRLVVVTESPCAEYWEDLWDLRPQVLLVGRYPALDLASAVARAAQGDRYRCPPNVSTPLTPTERRMLRLLACGQSNQQIAEHLTMQIQTIKNTLVTIYQTLGFKNRSEALLYYWGIWQALEGAPQGMIE